MTTAIPVIFAVVGTDMATGEQWVFQTFTVGTRHSDTLAAERAAYAAAQRVDARALREQWGKRFETVEYVPRIERATKRRCRG